MEKVNLRTILRSTLLALVLAASVWALWPPQDHAAYVKKDSPQLTSTSQYRPGIKYVLKISPGQQYIPGASPMGIGEPIHGLADVLHDFEARFLDTRVEVVVTPLIREYLVTQLSSGNAPDIINVNVEDVWVDIQKHWYIPLDGFLESPNEFIREKGDTAAPGYDHWWDMFKYQAISRGKAAPDRLTYCLSYDMVETGIFYNKDAFRKVNAEVPRTWEELTDIMARLEQAGYTPLAMVSEQFNDWCTDLFFDQLYANILPAMDLYKDPVREPYLQGYLDDFELYFLFQKGFFTKNDTRYREIWRIMHDMHQYTSRNMITADLNRDFVTQKAAMVWNGSWFVYRLKADQKLGFDWGVFYLPSFTKETTPYASEKPMCVIGGSAVQFEVTNTSIQDTPESMPFDERIRQSGRLERVMQLLQFLCVPENYTRIVNEYECFVPNIVGVPTLPALKPFEDILQRDYTTTKWVFSFDLKFNEIQRRSIEMYLNDGISLDEFMDWQTANIQYATNNLKIRKGIDLPPLQKMWGELRPLRKTIKDLPCDD